MDDAILISQLELSARIGITEAEREHPQRLTVSLTLFPRRDFSALEDRIANTVDYDAVCSEVRSLSSQTPRHLLETLAQEIARTLLATFPLRAVEVELRKFILPKTEFVAVKIRRDAD